MNNYDDLFTANGEKKDSKTERPFNKEEWAAQKKAQREEAYALVDATCSEMMTDGRAFQQYLDVQGRFDRYSVNNAILVAAQMPEATQLKDYNTWKQSRVYVDKDADKITILEPGKEYKRDDGSKAVGYNAKVVYDISQTTARDEAQPQVSYDDRLLLKGLIASSPVPIRAVEELPQGRGAVYDPEQNAILVKKGMDAPDIFHCVSLEAANVQLAQSHEGYSREAEGYKAYAVSYMLCQRYGVDVKGYDISRLDGVLQGQDPREEVPAALTDMRDTFKEMNGRMARAMGLTRTSRQKEQER